MSEGKEGRITIANCGQKHWLKTTKEKLSEGEGLVAIHCQSFNGIAAVEVDWKEGKGECRRQRCSFIRNSN